MNTAERRTHAKGPAGPVNDRGGVEIVEVVRYAWSGIWYLEGPITGRRRLNLDAAAETAVDLADRGGEILLRVVGGRQFDRRVAARLAQREEGEQAP